MGAQHLMYSHGVNTAEQEPAPLRLVALRLHSYRRFLDLDFYPNRLNVIVGTNGAGKSALLQAISVTLSRFTSRLTTGRSGGLQIGLLDIHNQGVGSGCGAVVAHSNRRYVQAVYKLRPGRGSLRGLNPTLDLDLSDVAKMALLNELADTYRERLATDAKAGVPVVVLYPVNRAVTDIPSRIRTRHSFDQVAAYDGAFQSQRNFRTFFEWFREREDLENEERVDRPKHRDPQLAAVRHAIERFMPGYRDLRVRRNPLRMTIKKGAEELRVDQLSDGEKVLLSLVGDLARRMAIANPGLEDPLTGEGIVMVDEIDLHLHPSWQRRVIDLLPATFPNVQFFLTTHSPVVASATPADSLWILEEGTIRPVEAYGQDVSLVLSEVFGTSPRLETIQKDLDDLFASIADGKVQVAEVQLEKLGALVGPSDPELVRARTMLMGVRAR